MTRTFQQSLFCKRIFYQFVFIITNFGSLLSDKTQDLRFMSYEPERQKSGGKIGFCRKKRHFSVLNCHIVNLPEKFNLHYS